MFCGQIKVAAAFRLTIDHGSLKHMLGIWYTGGHKGLHLHYHYAKAGVRSVFMTSGLDSCSQLAWQ